MPAPVPSIAPPSPGFVPLTPFGPPPAAAPARPRRRPETEEDLIDRLEAAVRAGVIDLHDDWSEVEEVAITGGELALLLRIVLGEAADRAVAARAAG